MPALIAPVIVSAASAIGVTVTLATATAIASGLIFVSTLVYGVVQQRRMKEAARRQGNASLQDRTLSIIASDAPWQIIYGEATVGAVLSDMLTSGDKDQYKHVVHVWANHECHAIEDILVKGESIGPLDANGNVTGGKWFKTETKSGSQTVAFNGAGQATLAQVPTVVQTVSRETSDIDSDGRDTIISTVLPITGLSISGKTITLASLAGQTLRVNYTYSTGGKALLRVHHHLGSPAQTADATLLAELGGAWGVNDRLAGLCYSVIRYDLNEPEFQGGPPQVTARIKGCKVFDPRTGATAWSDNNALCTAHFLQAEWGKGALSAQVVWPSVSAAANACDEVLGTPAGQKLYTCNGSFKTDQDTDTTLTQLCQSMAGFAVYSGAWSLQAGVYTAPVMALTDADNAGAVEVIGAPPGNELFNGLRGKFYDPARFDQLTDYTPYKNAAFVTEDGRAMWAPLDLPFTNANWRCANLARVAVERARGMQLVYPAKNRTRALRAGNRLTLSNSVLGMTNAVFRVVKREHRIGQPVMLTLAQDDASMYDQADAPASLPSPSVPVSDPFFVEPVADLAVVSDITVAKWNLDGTVLSNTYVSWAPSTDALVLSRGAMQVEYRAAEASAWTRLPEAPGDSIGVHLPLLPERQLFFVGARWRNSLGVTGDWRYAWVLTERLPGPRPTASLIDATWWRPGAAWEWALNQSDAGENSIVWGIGPKDQQQPLWRCVAAGAAGAGADGGWEWSSLPSMPKNALLVDPRKSYRFAVAVMRQSGTAGVYWGPSPVVCTLNTGTPAPNPYFANISGLPLNHWHLMVGYVFPAGSTGLTNAGAGIFDMETGELVQAGINYCWAADAVECSTRAYQFYASTGALQFFAAPVVELLDGYDAGRITYLGAQQVKTRNVENYAITTGSAVVSGQSVGSTGSPGSSVRVTELWGPAFDHEATDELDIKVTGLLDESFWSQAAIARVELQLAHAPSFGGTKTDFGPVRKFWAPIGIYTTNTQFALDHSGLIAPGAGVKHYVLSVRIYYFDAAGAAKSCGKDYTADAEWTPVVRMR